ncbi:glycosyltransferase family 9 protein [Rudaea sp.]|uniref:glycosyltransferase family 9 protein n=1 Tax=Rudaea sp. TaxID=2136325 RepID=UPI00321FCAB2
MPNEIRHSNDSPAKSLRRRVARWFSRRLAPESTIAADLPEHVPARGIHRILVCRATRTLGETLLLSPLLQEIEARFPGAEVDIVSGCGAAPALFARYAQVRRVSVLPRSIARAPLRYRRMLAELRGAKYDLAIDPYLLSHSDRLLVRTSQARFRIGFDGPKKSGHLTHALAAPRDEEHAAKLPVYLLRKTMGVGGDAATWTYPELDLHLCAAEREQGCESLRAVVASGAPAQPRATIGVYAFATGVKNYPREWWQRLLAVLAARYPDHAIVEIVPGFGRSLLDDAYPAYFSSDIRKLGGVLANLSLYVSADCGIMHLAAASGAPTVGIFSVTDIPGWSVYGARNHTIDARGLDAAQTAAALIAALGEDSPTPANARPQ